MTTEEAPDRFNPINKGDIVYFVQVAWGNVTPKLVAARVVQSSHKQIKIDCYGPGSGAVYWIALDGTPRHGEYYRGDVPAFFVTATEALASYRMLRLAAIEKLKKQIEVNAGEVAWCDLQLATHEKSAIIDKIIALRVRHYRVPGAWMASAKNRLNYELPEQADDRRELDNLSLDYVHKVYTALQEICNSEGKD